MVRPCDEDERGAPSENNVRRGKRKKKKEARPTVERCLLERHDTWGDESGQHSKQGIIEEENKQTYNNNNFIYRRPQMTGQVRDERGRRASSAFVAIRLFPCSIAKTNTVIQYCYHRIIMCKQLNIQILAQILDLNIFPCCTYSLELIRLKA